MGKMYYTEEEAAGKLGVSPAELANFVRDEKLRVFQDGPRKMYKVEEVDALSGSAEEIELAPAEGGIQDTVSLSEADEAQDATKEDTVITAEGISIFDDEDLEIEAADPMAKTQIAPSLEEQVALEGVGSGSGLLDLTRESDDTSLGAEVLDHIDMEAEVESGMVQEEPPAAATAVPQPEPVLAEPAVAEVMDASAGAFGGMIVGCAVLAMVLGGVMLAAMRGVVPDFVAGLKNQLLLVLIIGAVVIGAGAVVGYVVGKAAADRRAAMRRMGG